MDPGSGDPRGLNILAAPLLELAQHPKTREALDEFGARSTGSSTCIRRATLADFELSKDKEEIRDKDSINQRTILRNKADIVNSHYQEKVSEQIIALNG